MRFKKIMAMTLSAAMVVGNSALVFADGVSSATGSGTTFEHVNKEILNVTLPTTDSVSGAFDYIVDPERLINDAGTLVSANEKVSGNDDGVYFANSIGSSTPERDATAGTYSISGASTGYTVVVPTDLTCQKLVYDAGMGLTAPTAGWYEEGDSDYSTSVNVTVSADAGGAVTLATGDYINVIPHQDAITATTTYSSSSNAVSFNGRNSVDVDVSVNASVTATPGGKDIALVADEAALAAAKTPALLMKVKVGDEIKTVTSANTTAKAKIEGVSENFIISGNGSKFVCIENPDAAALSAWDSTTVQLIGKSNVADVAAGTNAMTAPQINLTWTIAKHVEGQGSTGSTASKSYVDGTHFSASKLSIGLNMPTGVNVTDAKLVRSNNAVVQLTSGTNYNVANSRFTLTGPYGPAWPGGTVQITFSDGQKDTVQCDQ